MNGAVFTDYSAWTFRTWLQNKAVETKSVVCSSHLQEMRGYVHHYSLKHLWWVLIPKTMQMAPNPYRILFWNDHKRKQVHIQHICISVFLTQACGSAGVTPTHTDNPLACHSVHSPALDAFGSSAMSWLPQNQIHLVDLQFTSFLMKLTPRNYLIGNDWNYL